MYFNFRLNVHAPSSEVPMVIVADCQSLETKAWTEIIAVDLTEFQFPSAYDILVWPILRSLRKTFLGYVFFQSSTPNLKTINSPRGKAGQGKFSLVKSAHFSIRNVLLVKMVRFNCGISLCTLQIHAPNGGRGEYLQRKPLPTSSSRGCPLQTVANAAFGVPNVHEKNA